MNTSKIKNICIIILSIILFVYLVLFINSLTNHEKVGFFNIRFYIMPADSVEMGLNKGDMVFAKTIKPEKIKENDKVLYKKDDVIYVEKVISASNNNGKVNLVINEKNEVENAQIIGKVIGKASRIGNTALFVQSPLGTFNIIILAICIIVIVRKIIGKTENDANEEG